MADGSTLPFKDVAVGDMIRSYDTETREFLPGRVSAKITHSPEEVPQLVWINGIGVTPEHPFYVNGVWKQVGDARIGDHLISDSGWIVDVVTIEWGPGGVEVQNLTIDNPTHDYFAGGVLVHNVAQKPGYAAGGWVDETGLALVHKGEYVLSRPDLGFANPGSDQAPSVGQTTINFSPVIQAWDGEDVDRFFRGKGKDVILELFRRNTGGFARSAESYSSRYRG
jgi:hypothetical protein